MQALIRGNYFLKHFTKGGGEIEELFYIFFYNTHATLWMYYLYSPVPLQAKSFMMKKDQTNPLLNQQVHCPNPDTQVWSAPLDQTIACKLANEKGQWLTKLPVTAKKVSSK